MSRIIIKNLPPNVSEDRLREHFASRGGLITDCQLKYSKTGQFRQFAFIGFKTSNQADEAIRYFNQTFLDTKKVVVEQCMDLSSRPTPAKERFKKDFKRKINSVDDSGWEPKANEGRAKKSKMNPFGELEEDPEFQQFLSVQRNVTTVGEGTQKLAAPNKYIWSDDLLPGNEPIVSREKQMKEAKRISKMKAKRGEMGDEEDEQGQSDEGSVKETTKSKKTEENPADKLPKLPEKAFEFTIKVKGLPPKVKKRQIKDFFKPLKYISLRIPRGIKGLAYLSFADPKVLQTALMKHRGFIDGRRIEVTQYDVKSYRNRIDKQREMIDKQSRWATQSAPPLMNPEQSTETADEPVDERNSKQEVQHESLAETGRLFVRNLSYECTQEDLEELFSKYGQLAEVHLSIDTFTGKPKGFAFVEFVFPEHALVAFNEQDGKTFQGRMLHIIPARAKPEGHVNSSVQNEIESQKSSFKKEKKAKEHQAAGMSHNWNALFLGTNAVADVIAEKAGVTKAQLLADREAKDSLGVRVALAETQIVNETRQFLTDNGINLDAFSNDKSKDKKESAKDDKGEIIAPLRSKTVMLAKNLPSGTTADELRELFSRHGSITKLLLPPYGITAIVEMGQPTEAKSAFKALAYSNFKHAPLYLEWAPVDVIRARSEKSEEANAPQPKEVASKSQTTTQSDESGTTLFVKNLNFSTQESSLEEHFSKYGPICSIIVARRKHNGKQLSMGYGFVQFYRKESADEALKLAQHSTLDGHTLELMRSNRKSQSAPIQPMGTVKKFVEDEKGEQTFKDQEGVDRTDEVEKNPKTKLVVRNIPFEASEKEVRQLFANFGDLKACRLPKKASGTGTHRGFAFVDFVTTSDAKRAFHALSASTHLYGRRLVIEWATVQGNE